MVIERERLAELLASKQEQEQRIVFTNGVFDLLHLGHLRYLRQARRLGALLVIGVNSDESARQLKGPQRPLVPEAERAELLAALDCVDYVTIFGERTAEATLALLQPEVYVKGADYAEGANRQQDTLLDAEELRRALTDDASLGKRLPEARIVADYGGSLALLAYLPGHSTSDLIDRIVARYGPDADARP
jgi:D-beta-D-heptose 7-phosphate kinase/D-beta-D-heptose 1-phosphate adenosyltransferase